MAEITKEQFVNAAGQFYRIMTNLEAANKKLKEEIAGKPLEADVELKKERDRLLRAVQTTYRKHHLSDESIGWDELSDILLDALCESMGDVGYQKWLEALNP